MAYDIIDPLILDLLAWLGKAQRPYSEVMEVWRTSCPRLTVWEDALDRGYVVRRWETAGEAVVALTPLGARRLEESAAGVPAA